MRAYASCRTDPDDGAFYRGCLSRHKLSRQTRTTSSGNQIKVTIEIAKNGLSIVYAHVIECVGRKMVRHEDCISVSWGKWRSITTMVRGALSTYP